MNQIFLDFAKKVTEEIIEELKSGRVIWQKPWHNGEGARNYATGRAYEGFNQFYLSYKAAKNNYPTNLFLSFQQARALGGFVRKGEHGTMVVYWKIGTHQTGKKITDEQGNEKEQTKQLFYPFIHFVFNIAQIEGVEFKKVRDPIGKDNTPLVATEEIIARMPQPVTIQTGGHTAYYSPLFDYVQLPDKQHFISSEAYYNCLFHELIHSTGHSKRLHRFATDFTPAIFGDENYSREELIAEMGAIYLSSYAGISSESLRNNSTAYLQGWMKALENDNTLIITAANKAQKAAAFILRLNGNERRAGRAGKQPCAV